MMKIKKDTVNPKQPKELTIDDLTAEDKLIILTEEFNRLYALKERCRLVMNALILYHSGKLATCKENVMLLMGDDSDTEVIEDTEEDTDTKEDI